MRRVTRFLFAAVLLVCVSSVALAQTGQVGTLAGTVKDQTGAVLPGVTVEAKHQERGVIRSAVTDTAGRFRLHQMPLGAYTVTASLTGFDTASVKDNMVESDRTTDVTVTMRLGAAAEAITVTGEVPIVDKTNVTVTSRVRSEEFQKLPIGRSYQSLMGIAPGVVGTGNASVHGALTSNNQFLFDGVDTTDPTTGTFGSNLNFESIQEVTLMTAGLSAEYGRAVGAVVSVVTKSGGNTFSGSAKFIGTNDEWNEQNRTKNEVTGASLSRTKFDKVNPVNSFTLGGPFWKDRVWFFGSYEKSKNTTAQQTTAITNENFQQTTESPFWTARVTAQITPAHSVWVRGHESPTNGFMVNYGNAAELYAYTRQDQTGESTAGQWTGIFGTKVSAEVFAAEQKLGITVFPFRTGPTTGGALHFNLADGFYYNNAFFDGFVDRPRKQFIAAMSVFQDFMGRSHDIKFGFDRQDVESGALFTFGGNVLYIDSTFDPVTRNFTPNQRRDYDPPAASTSEGQMTAFYVRDKFDLTEKLFVEAGIRYEAQTGNSDIDVDTVDTASWSPRLSFSYDLKGTGRSLIVGSYARPYQFIQQSFSDAYANVPQQANYTNYTWNGTAFVQTGRVVAGAGTIAQALDLNASYVDEITLGYQQQLGNVIGVGIRGIWRSWGDLIDDVRGFNADGTQFRRVVNYDEAEREYRGVELTFEKRFSNNWYANANYTWSRATGNHFDNTFSSLGDYLDTNCRSTIDPSIGSNGIIPCREVQEGANKSGRSPNDRPHNIKAQGAYVFRLGPVNLTTGMTGNYISGVTYTPNQTVNVLRPGTTTNAGPTASYFYEQRGSRRTSSTYDFDGSVEATYRLWRTVELGMKGEVFNIFDRQDKLTVNLTAYCANTNNASATCTTQRDRFGKATSRGAFRSPRSYRITALLRF